MALKKKANCFTAVFVCVKFTKFLRYLITSIEAGPRRELLTCIQDLSDSNLGWDTNPITSEVFRGFHQPLHQNSAAVP
jgi:hypothetical protein